MITIAEPRLHAPAGEGTPAEPTDAALAQRAAAGDAHALSELVRKHAKAIHALAFHLASSRDVSDATQASLEKLVTRIGSYDPSKGSFRAWALAVTRHTCLDRLRRRGRERRAFPVHAEADSAAAQADAPDPERAALARIEADALRDALSELPEPMRSALVLFHVHEASYEDIAATLEVPIGTVMTWLHRGRKRLREAFDRRSEKAP